MEGVSENINIEEGRVIIPCKYMVFTEKYAKSLKLIFMDLVFFGIPFAQFCILILKNCFNWKKYVSYYLHLLMHNASTVRPIKPVCTQGFLRYI